MTPVTHGPSPDLSPRLILASPRPPSAARSPPVPRGTRRVGVPPASLHAEGRRVAGRCSLRRYPGRVVALDAAFWAVCLVLVASGATKLADPVHFAASVAELGLTPTRRAAGRPAGELAARATGGVEVLVGLWGLAAGGSPSAVVVAVLYAGFAVVVVAARRRGLSTCGCFGARSGPPSALHVVLNVACAGVAAGAAAVGPAAVADSVEQRGVAGVWWVLAALAGAVAVAALQTSRSAHERRAR